MVTLIKYGALSGGEKYNVNALSLDGLSTDTKPTRTYIEYGSDGREVGRMGIPNGSLYTEIDTGDTYMYDADNATWHKVSIGGGGGGTQGGIVLVGETTTHLVDNATTNPITVDGQSYTAQPNDAVIYGNKEFLFDGTKWHEFGDLSGLSSKDIGAMTNYVKAQTGAAIAATDTLNQAIGKVEKRVEVNENNISKVQAQADWNSNTGVTNLFDFDTWTQGLTAIRGTVSISENSVTVQATSNDAFTNTNTLDIPVKPNTKYILTWDSTATIEHNGNVYIFTNSITNYKKAIAEKYEFTTNSGDTSFKVRFGVDVSGDSITYSNIMLRSGTITDDTYQPYAMSNAELTAKEQANENNILSEQAKTTGMTAGGTDYITVNGIRVYVSATAPTGNIPVGSLWIGG